MFVNVNSSAFEPMLRKGFLMWPVNQLQTDLLSLFYMALDQGLSIKFTKDR